ncbi:MAG: DegT/DnrJ/EryC1/StrS family aminotransferase [Acidimicrobiia bacterium]|nr:DegT/DnrJ/EryC1/StrS family aminotransferase [Acidimicrobiia bacterium]
MVEGLEEIFGRAWLTNSGPVHDRLEERLRHRLGVPHLSLLASGTAALQLGGQALGLRDEVVTTPFTFPATAQALAWMGITPVFVDVEPVHLTLDPERIEEVLTPRTTGILPVHVFGNVCRVDEIAAVARRHDLRVLYDAAHAFGVTACGAPVGNLGDASAFSFHATKVFHTLEGGALTYADESMGPVLRRLRNFGMEPGGDVELPGINAKLNEVQALVGLLVLDQVDQEIAHRRQLVACYRSLLAGLDGIRPLPEQPGVDHNGSYLPVIVDEAAGTDRSALLTHLASAGVHARPYFRQLCSHFPHFRDLPSAAPDRLPVAERAAARVACLPLHGAMSSRDVERVCSVINDVAG